MPRLRSRDDKKFFVMHVPTTFVALLILLSMLAAMLVYSLPILHKEGIDVFIKNVWIANENNPNAERYGLAAAIFGTLYTGFISLLVAMPLSIALAIVIEEFVPKKMKSVVSVLSDLMAATPTIIYGIWAMVYLVPLMYKVLSFLNKYLGWLPFFSEPPLTGFTIATAGVMLGIMATPYAASLIREAYTMIPHHLREAAYSLGATRYEGIRLLLSTIKPSIVAATALAFARAVGETVAVSLVIGNSFNISPAVTVPGYTISSLIAAQFPNAGLYTYMESALFAGGLALFAIGLVVNIIAVYYMKKWEESIGHA